MSLYVTDTHPLIWYGDQRAKLSKPALRIFDKADRGDVLIYIPAMVILEVGILRRIGRVRSKEPFDIWINRIVVHAGFEIASLDPEILSTAVALQTIIDPFDMSIVATAKHKNLPLITADDFITTSQLVETIW